MTSDERADSLAEQAAAWVPPWARQRRTDPAASVPQVPTVPLSTDVKAPQAAADGVDVAVPEPVEAAETAEPAENPGSDAEEPPEVPAAPEPAAEPFEVAPSSVSAPGPVSSVSAPSPVSPPIDAPQTGPAPLRGTTLALADDEELRGALEAILLVVDEPVSEIVLAQVLEQPTDRITRLLHRIAEGYTATGHGFELRRAAGGWRLYTRPEYAGYVERFILDGQSVRLTQAALETLAVVAYKQPVTRSRISAIRGVNCDGVIRTLVSRGLIEECGTEPNSGAFLYRTTTLFLEKLGLDTVEELPSLAPFLPDDVEEMVDAPR